MTAWKVALVRVDDGLDLKQGDIVRELADITGPMELLREKGIGTQDVELEGHIYAAAAQRSREIH